MVLGVDPALCARRLVAFRHVASHPPRLITKANHTSVRRRVPAQAPLPVPTGALTVRHIGTVAHGLPHLLAAPAFLALHLADGGEATPIVPAVEADHVGLGQSHPTFGERRPLVAGQQLTLDLPEVPVRSLSAYAVRVVSA